MYDKHRGLVYWVYGSAAAMVIGAFGPWVAALGTSVSGIDGSNDGWLVIGAAALGVIIFWTRRDTREAAIGPVLAALGGLAITIYDRQHVQHAIDRGGAFARALAHVGWGLNLALLASLSIGVAGIVWWTRAAAQEVPLPPPVPPAESPTPPPSS